MPRNRRNTKWLHAGVIKNVQGKVKDVWYSFYACRRRDCRCDGLHLRWARKANGAKFRNYGVGQIYRNMITWDEDHEKKWFRYLSPEGTWITGMALRGRKVQRQTLRDHWLDPHSRDRYPDGRAHDYPLAPSLNVVHSVDDKRGAAINYNAYVDSIRQKIGPGKCYPGSKIPVSIDGIQPNAWKEDCRPAIDIAMDFVTGLTAKRMGYEKYRARINTRIESALFELGFRIDRVAMCEANQAMRTSELPSVFSLRCWNEKSLLRINTYIGDELEELIRPYKAESRYNYRDDGGICGDKRGSGRRDHGSGGGSGSGTRGRRNDQPDDHGDSDSDRDDNRGNGGSRAHRPRQNRDIPGRSHRSDVNNGSDDEDGLFVSQREPSYISPEPRSTSSGPSGRSGSKLMQRLAMIAREEKARRQNQDIDNLEYLPDDSPFKGKNTATRKRSSLGKRAQVEDDEVKTGDDDLMIDEARSAPSFKKVKVREDPDTKVIEILDDEDNEFSLEVKQASSFIVATPSVDANLSVVPGTPTPAPSSQGDNGDEMMIDEA